MKDGCFFCVRNGPERDRTPAFYVMSEDFPVTPGHALIVARRHVSRLKELNASEKTEMLHLILSTQAQLTREDPSIGGFNVGVNDGACAGQTVFHLHIHVIPRRAGDVPDPRGGVRGVIPGQQKYD